MCTDLHQNLNKAKVSARAPACTLQNSSEGAYAHLQVVVCKQARARTLAEKESGVTLHLGGRARRARA